MYSNQTQIKDTSNPLNKDSKGVIDISSQKLSGIALNFSGIDGPNMKDRIRWKS